jgi:hypothetical protein
MEIPMGTPKRSKARVKTIPIIPVANGFKLFFPFVEAQ